MVITCFSCENLLSDFHENLLPAVRHEEIKEHLQGCDPCSTTLRDLKTSLEILGALPLEPLGAELSLRVTEAADAKKVRLASPRRLSRISLAAAVAVLLFLSVTASFPGLFPWFNVWRGPAGRAEFTRFYPLMNGAEEILEEQGTWLRAKEALSGSLWEEGGLSPEEFEKTFQTQRAEPES